jgi:hypothetical protein
MFASRMSPDKEMKSIVRVKMSLISFIWAYLTLLSHMWTVMFMQCDTQCLCQGKISPLLYESFVIVQVH